MDSLRDCKILVAEDEPELGQMMVDFLAREQANVRLVRDGKAALDEARRWSPDLMLLDIRMPARDGLSVLVAYREIDPHVPAILITALGDDLDRLTGFRLGADDYVVKPFNPLEVVARARAVVRRRQLVGLQENIYQPDAALVSGLLRQIDLIDQLTTDISLLYDTSGSSEALQKSPVDVRAICDAVVYSLTPLAQESGAEISAPGSANPVEVDAAKLERAIANVVRNAIQHGKCKRISLSVSMQDDALVIDCDDDGVGWPTDTPDDLLKAFATGDGRAKRPGGRTGLGLALVEAIAKAHGGKLVLEMSSMGGAKAAIFIPAQ